MRVLIFGGTTEGRKLAGVLSSNGAHDVTLCVATEYGKNIIPKNAEFLIMSQRLNQAEMIDLIEKDKFDYVIDATHPYAGEATKNIKAACGETHTEYLRLIRDESSKNQSESVIYAGNAAQAADLLKNTSGNVLMTVGSKELAAFTIIENYSSRLFVRIIPMIDSLQKVIGMGFNNANIICMQGPFEADMNAAMLKMTNAAYMVTKDSGDAGGFSKKIMAAEQTGCKVIVIARPSVETGYDFHEILRFFNIAVPNSAGEDSISVRVEGKNGFRPYFPLFTDINGKKITVIGGGKIAERRIKTLLNYNADITVVSPCITDDLRQTVQRGEIKYVDRKYISTDISNAFLVIAAVNDRAVNHTVMKDAKSAGILVIVSDNREECDCYFPAIAENGEYIAGIVSKNGNHTGLKELAQELRRFLNHE